MPTFVVQTLGKPASKVNVEGDAVRIGRETTNDIVLPEDSVSREHAVARRGPGGRWVVECLSTTNPIVVNGRLTRDSASLEEGGELLVGNAFLLIFSEDTYRADQYINVKTVFEQKRCTGCSWEGMISSARKNATCPRCNGAAFVDLGGYSGESRRAAGSEAPDSRLRTAALGQEEAFKAFRAIKTAKRSHIERVDGHAGTTPRTELREDQSVVLQRGPDPMLALHGVVFGSVTVRWDGERYIAESRMIFPKMKINGEQTKSAHLRSGDVITVGGNAFKFVTE